MDTQPTNSPESVAAARTVDIDWSCLSTAEQIRHVELEGYVVLPGLLTADQIGLAEAMATEWLAARAPEEAEDEEDSPALTPRVQSFPVP